MNKKTLTALKASIEKWEQNVLVKRKKDARIYKDSCALCHLYYERFCDGCPVEQDTGLVGCIDTPWEEAEEAYRDGPLARFRKAAQSEVDFLKSLLPKEKPNA